MLALACDSQQPEVAADGAPDAGAIEEKDATQQISGLRPEQLNGDYLLVVSLTAAPRAPTVFLAQIEAEREGDHLLVRMRQEPLSKADRSTPVGLWSGWATGELSPDGSFESEVTRAYIPAEANAVTGLDTEAEIGLASHFQIEAGSGDEPIDFLCGDVLGRIIGPIPVDDLSGSTFTATRIEDVEDLESYPDAVINCNRDPARAL